MGTLTFTIATTSPSQNLTKTFTDTDANIVLFIAALVQLYGGTNAQAALSQATAWKNEAVNITQLYQKSQDGVTPINPT